MQHFITSVASHTLDPLGTPSLVLELPELITIGPGQFMLVCSPRGEAPVRSRLFPLKISTDRIVFDALPDPSWLPGQTIDVFGPIGNTFSPPEAARNWLLLSLGHHPERLLPLLGEGLARSAALVLWSLETLPDLVPDIERPATPGEAVAWADFIAIELNGPAWPEAHRSLSVEHLDQTAALIQALVDVPTPCGTGGCQACAIPGRNGYLLACQKGLVRSYEELRD